jgi:DNA-binding MarR family transcriptional regulator
MSRQDKLNPPILIRGSDEPAADELRLEIDLRLTLDEIANGISQVLQDHARRQPTKKALTRLACRIYDARRTRDRMLNGQLFGEPAWDTLLALYCLPARGEMLHTTALAYAANVGPTTGLRWQRLLMAEGLIERGPKELSPRRQFVRLTQTGRSMLEAYLTRLYFSTTAVPPFPDRAGG